MKTVVLSRRSAKSSTPSNYRLDISVTSSDSITSYLFVKQRVIRSDGSVDDTFVTIASPTQIEDIPQSTPASGDCYFRDNTISLVSNDPALIEEISDQIVADIQLTLIQSTDLEDLSVAETVTINPTTVTVDTGS